MKSLSLLMVLLMLAGCETPPPALPVHDWRGPHETLAAMAARTSKIQTASGTATLTLRRPDGAEVTVDSAFAAKPPEALRIRAWKFDRAVADWTFKSDGVWAWQAEGEDAAPQTKPSGPWSANHAQLWPLMLGMIEPKAGDEIIEGPGISFTVRRRIVTVVVETDVDGATQTVKACRIITADGVTVQRITLARYRDFSGALFPMRVIATGDHGSFQLDFSEVSINDELPASAFTPPKRASRLP